MTTPETTPTTTIPTQRNFQIPGCVVSIHSEGEGITTDEFLAIAFSLAHSNPDAIVHFDITVRGDADSEDPSD